MTGKYYAEADQMVKNILKDKRHVSPPRFELKVDMQINIYGYKYKIQKINPNGNLKLKFLHYDAAEAAKWGEI